MRCEKILESGKRCHRHAQENSKYCWQHKSISSKSSSKRRSSKTKHNKRHNKKYIQKGGQNQIDIITAKIKDNLEAAIKSAPLTDSQKIEVKNRVCQRPGSNAYGFIPIPETSTQQPVAPQPAVQRLPSPPVLDKNIMDNYNDFVKVGLSTRYKITSRASKLPLNAQTKNLIDMNTELQKLNETFMTHVGEQGKYINLFNDPFNQHLKGGLYDRINDLNNRLYEYRNRIIQDNNMIEQRYNQFLSRR